MGGWRCYWLVQTAGLTVNPAPSFFGAGFHFLLGCDALARKVFIIMVVVFLSLSLFVSASGDSVVCGQTLEQGTGEKSPDNPYSLTGYLPEEVRQAGTIYGVPFSDSLYGDGTVCDEYDVVTGLEVRRWYRVVFDGTENIYTYSSPGGSLFYIDDLPVEFLAYTENGQTDDLFCTHFVPAINYTKPSRVYIANNGKSFYIPATTVPWVDDAQSLKDWLSAQYAAGTPLTIVYQLAVPRVIHHEPVVLGKYMPESVLDSLGWMVQRVVSVIGMVTISPLLLLGLAMWAAGGAIALFRRLV